MWEFQQIEPQPARGVLREEMWEDPKWYAETKYDGDRRICQIIGRVGRFTGRRKSAGDGLFVEKTANVPHLGQHLKAGWDGTVLDGEIIAPPGIRVVGGLSKWVTSIMGSKPDEAIRKQRERGYLCYAVFDCLAFKGKWIRQEPLYVRRQYAERAMLAFDRATVFLAQASGMKRDLYRRTVEHGGEGVILKNVDHRYGDKLGWVKVKAEWTADVVIVAFTEAKTTSTKVTGEVSRTKYAGQVGAIIFGQFRDGKLWECGQCSGFNEEMRRYFTRYPKDWIGKVMKIKHKGREPSGKFRHPQFDGVRTDKRATQCIYNPEET